MTSENLPPIEGMSVEEARHYLNRLKAAMRDRAHPYWDAAHPQHGEAVALFGALHTVIREGEAAAQAARAEAELAAALGDDAGLSPEESRALANRLIKTPDYLTHEPGAPRMLDVDRERIRAKIHALHENAARVEGAERANAEAERASAPEADGEVPDADVETDDAW